MPRAGPEELRLFFAIPLAEELRDRAVELQRELDRAGAKVKWVARPNLHMTLKFIGEVAADRLRDFCGVAAQVAASARGCELTVGGVGCFRSRGTPRTIWLGAQGDTPALAELAASLDAALAQAGLAEPERREFVAHFTLGRVKSGRKARELLAAIDALAAAPVGPMAVDRFVLMSSELTPEGPAYTEEATFGLGPRTAKVGRRVNNA